MVSPLSTAKLTFSSARTMPERVRNSTLRPSTESVDVMRASSCPSPGIDHVAQAVAEKIEAEYRNHQSETREGRVPPFARNHELRAFRHHDAPFRRRRPHAQANK